MCRKIVFFILFFVFASLTFAQSDFIGWYNKGNQQYEGKQYAEAASSYQSALNLLHGENDNRRYKEEIKVINVRIEECKQHTSAKRPAKTVLKPDTTVNRQMPVKPRIPLTVNGEKSVKLSFGKDGGEEVCEVKSSSNKWTVWGGKQWVTTLADGEKLKVIVEKNHDIEPREAMLSVRTGSEEVSIAVNQEASPLYLLVDGKDSVIEKEVDPNGGSFTFNVETNSPEGYGLRYSRWIRLVKDTTNSFTVKADTIFLPYKDRKGKVEVVVGEGSATSKTVTINFTQRKRDDFYYSVDGHLEDFEYEGSVPDTGGVYTFSVVTNVPEYGLTDDLNCLCTMSEKRHDSFSTKIFPNKSTEPRDVVIAVKFYLGAYKEKIINIRLRQEGKK